MYESASPLYPFRLLSATRGLPASLGSAMIVSSVGAERPPGELKNQRFRCDLEALDGPYCFARMS